MGPTKIDPNKIDDHPWGAGKDEVFFLCFFFLSAGQTKMDFARVESEVVSNFKGIFFLNPRITDSDIG